jgi:hypothetical protein
MVSWANTLIDKKQVKINEKMPFMIWEEKFRLQSNLQFFQNAFYST